MDQTGLYIDGRWHDSDTSTESRNPSDVSDVIGRFAQASAEQLDLAVDAARRAQPAWRDAGIQKRHDALMAIGTELMARAGEIGELVSREEGKPLAEGKGEVYRAGQFFTYFAAEALRLHGDLAESVRPGIEIDVRREPVGVVAVISPWNFPIAMSTAERIGSKRRSKLPSLQGAMGLAKVHSCWRFKLGVDYRQRVDVAVGGWPAGGSSRHSSRGYGRGG